MGFVKAHSFQQPADAELETARDTVEAKKIDKAPDFIVILLGIIFLTTETYTFVHLTKRALLTQWPFWSTCSQPNGKM
jgi:hypothetical protein